MTEREQFEAEFRKRFGANAALGRLMRSPDSYALEQAQVGWEMWQAARASQPAPEPKEPIAWESTTPVYTKYITESRYHALRAEYQKWYKPVCQPAPEGLVDSLKSALMSVNAVAIERGDKFGVCDQIDNTGAPYQSQWLADLLKISAAPTAQSERTIRTHRERDQAAAIEKLRETEGDL